jgi:hypothetical protein
MLVVAEINEDVDMPDLAATVREWLAPITRAEHVSQKDRDDIAWLVDFFGRFDLDLTDCLPKVPPA